MDKAGFEELEIRKNAYITVSNDFVMQWRWSFSTGYVGKFIVILISLANYSTNVDFRASRCWAREIAKVIGICDGNWIGSIKRILESVKKEYVISPEGEKIYWFEYLEYESENQDIKWIVNSELAQFFLSTHLKKDNSGKLVGYVRLAVVECMLFKCGYSFRIYMLAMIYRKYSGKIYTVNEFADLLSLPISYRKFGALRVDVLDKAIADIHKNTKVKISVSVDKDKHMRANRVYKFKFSAHYDQNEENSINQAKQKQHEQNTDPVVDDSKIIDDIDFISESKQLLRQFLHDEGTIKRLAENYDLPRIKRNIQYVLFAKGDNYAKYGLIVKAIELDYAKENMHCMTIEEQQQYLYQQLGINEDSECPL